MISPKMPDVVNLPGGPVLEGSLDRGRQVSTLSEATAWLKRG
jgi:hypothetical protein